MDASQNRREFKFLLKPGIEPQVRAKVAAELAVDPNANDGYPVLSEYFDSSGRASYWQKQFGVPNRRRVRGRVYGRQDGTIPPSAFMEVKHKLDGTTVKRRIPVNLPDLSRFSGDTFPSDLPMQNEVDERVLGEIEDLVVNQESRPVVQIRYHRYAYDSGQEGRIRITFDTGLYCRFRLLPLLPDDRDFELPLLEPGAAVMEVKTIGPVPYWFRTLVGEFHLIPRGFSKYTIALEKYEMNKSTILSNIKTP
jgi:hypothetical protein